MRGQPSTADADPGSKVGGPSSPPPPERLASSVGWAAGIWAAFIGAVLIGGQLSKALGDPFVFKIVASGVAPAVVGVLVTLIIQVKRGGGWRDLGLRRASGRSLVVGLISGLPLLLAYALIFGVFDVDSTPVPHVGLVIVKFVVAQGIAEEVVFRGFVFGRLRRGRSFLRAATLSAVVFAVVHLSNFLNGFSVQVIIGVVTSTLFAFVLAYPAALLFERAGQTIWPFAITHVWIDSVNWFEGVSAPGPGLYLYLIAVLLTAGWTIALALRFLPTRPGDGAQARPVSSSVA